MPRDSLDERLVHYQYIEDLCFERRILEIGSGDGRGAAFLAELAQEVVSVDSSRVKIQQAQREIVREGVTFMHGEPDRLELPDESFDVVVVPELERWITRGSLMPEMRRLLRPTGVALFAVPSEDHAGGMEYNDLLEYLAQSFPHVRMIGEIRFGGTIVADFEPEDEELDPNLDCSLVEEDEDPHHYLALCSFDPLTPIAYSVIQTPMSAGETTRGSALDMALEQTKAELEREKLRADRTARELKAAAGRASREESRRVAHLNARVEQLERELEQERAAEVSEKLKLVSQQREALGRRVMELERYRSEHADLEGAVERLKAQLADAERRVLEESSQARQELIKTRSESRTKDDKLQALAEELGAAKSALDEARTLLAAQGLSLGTFDPKEVTPTEDPAAAAAAATAAPASIAKAAGGGEPADMLVPDWMTQRLASELDRIGELQSQLERERTRADGLARDLDAERQRQRAAGDELVKVRGEAERAGARGDEVERSLGDARKQTEYQRQRAEGAERRSDALINRIEQDAAELSRLHQRLAELQGLRQADQWRLDEVTGRLREAEARLASAGGASAGEAKAPAPAAAGGDPAALRSAETRAQRAEQRVKELSAELETAREQLELFEHHTDESDVASELRQVKKQLAQREEDLKLAIRAADDNALQDLRARTDQVRRLERQLKAAREEAATLRERLDGDASDELLRAGEQANAELAVARAELSAMRSREADVDALSSDLRSEIERLRHSEDELRAEVEALRKTPTDQLPAVSVGDASGGGNGAPDGAEARGELFELQRRQLEALLDGALEHKAQSDSLSARIEDLHDRIDELARERDRAERELSECRQRGRQRERELDDLRQQLTDTGRALARAEGELKRFRMHS